MDNNHNMPIDDVKYVSLATFLAGAILKKKIIPVLEFSRISADFGMKNDIYFSDDDYGKISGFVSFKDDVFSLKVNYDELMIYNGVKYKIFDYLYSLTNEMVREYFDIPKKEMIAFKGVKVVELKKKRS